MIEIDLSKLNSAQLDILYKAIEEMLNEKPSEQLQSALEAIPE